MPRSELFGASVLTFLCIDSQVTQKVLQDLMKNQAKFISQDENLNINDSNLRKIPADGQLVSKFIPLIQESAIMFQGFQLDFFSMHMKLCEMDMNLMSPITWCLNLKCYKSAKLYTNLLKDFS